MNSGGGTRTHNLDLNRILLCRIELPRNVHLDYPGNRAYPCLDLRVAIRAQQDALADLRANPVETSCDPSRCHAKLLLAGIEVMELQRDHRLVVAAQSTGPARLLDKYLLHAPATTNNGLGTARTAAEVAAAVSNVAHLTMPRTREKNFRKALRPRSGAFLSRPSACRAPSLQAMLAQPMAHGGLAPVHSCRDLRHRHTCIHERFQSILGEPTSRSVSLVPVGPQSMPIDPVRDGRFVALQSPADLGQREPFAKHPLQDDAIHASHCLQRFGRKREQTFVREARASASSEPPQYSRSPVSSSTRP
jgi:hypothetical protein